MLENKPKIIITGGHMSPMLAVISELQKKANILVIGRRYTFEADKTETLEYKLLLKLKIPFYPINAARFQRKFTKHTIPSLIKFPFSILEAYFILKKEKPNAILSFGGYVSLPVIVVGKILNIPIVLHEQTRKAGLSNKISSKFADKICISYSSSASFFDKKKTIFTGNPIRPELFMEDKRINFKHKKPIITVMGGSSGSHRLNLYIKDVLPKLLEKFNVLHQTGDAKEFNDYNMLEEYKKTLEIRFQESYLIKKFIETEEIGSVFKNTDIFVCRAGANTVNELLYFNKKAVLVPLYFSQNNEQLENAKYFKESNLGTYIEEKDISSEKLYNYILEIYGKKIKTFPKPEINAAEKISGIVLNTAENARKNNA